MPLLLILLIDNLM